ncbi:reverse transcriptase domain-containing protein [Trichonephila clavipes]|nr:reverse transcriptase domain-containing protein [Trichonephila clavipes]
MDNKNLAYEKHPKYLGYVLDPEWSSHKHIDHIVSKCRKRLSILKFIAGKDWGADAVTLRDTFLALIRPILGTVFQCTAVRPPPVLRNWKRFSSVLRELLLD